MLKLFVALFLLFVNLSALTLQKANIYSDQNISGWVMSEKLDGIRAFWNGKNLLTRKGKPINAPAWFTQNLPPFELDGELWTKRGDFENIQSIVMDEVPHATWSEIKYMIFEVPHAKGDFIARLDSAHNYVKEKKLRHMEIIEQKICSNQAELDSFLESMLSLGGEGVMIKDASKEYFEGRSSSILKVKKEQDAEAKVIGYKNGSGKYTGMMGSLQVEFDNDIQFFIGNGFSDEQRKTPPKIGEIITFKYYGFTKNGVPKFASFMRVRKD
ncbi:MAG: DNA ligase [Helicobacteraceae bacterium CG2_30_36_10]|nr:MAG: DNA ligase [Helicobacteraceae bacterium CG2_30_36_10]